MLRLEGVETFYGAVKALKGVSFAVPDRGIVALLGANGAGKTTTLRSISGLTQARKGMIEFDGTRIERWGPDRVVGAGISLVPQGRLLFPELTVAENLELGAYLRGDRSGIKRDIEASYDRFPILRERRGQAAGTLSGGQQQMVAIAGSLMSRPRLLMLDEPSLGLAPMIVAEIFETIGKIRGEGMAILLIEQNARMALEIADHGFVLESGHVVLSGPAAALLSDPQATPTGYIPCDISPMLGCAFPATSPLVLVRYARIRAGEHLVADFAASGVICYVIAGGGTTTGGGTTVAWRQGDVLILPGGVAFTHAAVDGDCVLSPTNRNSPSSICGRRPRAKRRRKSCISPPTKSPARSN